MNADIEFDYYSEREALCDAQVVVIHHYRDASEIHLDGRVLILSGRKLLGRGAHAIDAWLSAADHVEALHQ